MIILHWYSSCWGDIFRYFHKILHFSLRWINMICWINIISMENNYDLFIFWNHRNITNTKEIRTFRRFKVNISCVVIWSLTLLIHSWYSTLLTIWRRVTHYCVVEDFKHGGTEVTFLQYFVFASELLRNIEEMFIRWWHIPYSDTHTD